MTTNEQIATVSRLDRRNAVILVLVDGTFVRHVAAMRQRGLTASTIQGRTNVVRLLIKHAQKPLIEITEADMESWQDTLGPLAPNSRCTYVSHIREVYAWMRERGLIDHNPADVLVTPKHQRGLPRPIPEPSLERALLLAPLQIRVWLELAGYDGFRAGEIARLERQDIRDRIDRPYFFVRGKGGRDRTVPASPVALASLYEYGLPIRGRVFRRPSGVPMTPRDVSRRVNNYLHGVGIPETGHQLRHRFGTQLLNKEPNLRRVQEIMGHASPATTAIYTLVDPRDAAPAVNAISRPLLRPVQDTGS